MRSERPLIISVLLLAAGLALILGYCHGTAGFNAAYPVAGASVALSITTIGPAAMGGVLLTVLGLLLLVWAFICAIVGQIQQLAGVVNPQDLPKEWIPKV